MVGRRRGNVGADQEQGAGAEIVLFEHGWAPSMGCGAIRQTVLSSDFTKLGSRLDQVQ